MKSRDSSLQDGRTFMAWIEPKSFGRRRFANAPKAQPLRPIEAYKTKAGYPILRFSGGWAILRESKSPHRQVCFGSNFSSLQRAGPHPSCPRSATVPPSAVILNKAISLRLPLKPEDTLIVVRRRGRGGRGRRWWRRRWLRSFIWCRFIRRRLRQSRSRRRSQRRIRRYLFIHIANFHHVMRFGPFQPYRFEKYLSAWRRFE